MALPDFNAGSEPDYRELALKFEKDETEIRNLIGQMIDYFREKGIGGWEKNASE